MSWQPNCAIAYPKATWYESAMPVVTANLPLRGQLTSRDLERWSG